MSEFRWTDSQRRAATTVDRRVLVSAAAGSGKTAVLAERAAYIVADLGARPPINLEDLLVVTFTEAAAAQMRSRIAEFIRQRLETRRGDQHLLQQLVRIDAAQICTIHAFCLQTLRQWFTYAEVDPNATVLDADEAELLRAEVLEALFAQLYDAEDGTGERFREFVRVYADGRDDKLAETVLKLHAFLQSVVAPDRWLADAVARFADVDETRLRADLCARLAEEIALQADACRHLVEQFRPKGPLGQFYAERFDDYRTNLLAWRARCDNPADYDALARTIEDYSFPALYGRKKIAGDDDGGPLDRRGQMLHTDTKKRLFNNRIKERFTSLDLSRCLADIRNLQTPVQTLVDLTCRFADRYDHVKRTNHQLDFADLERRTLDLLTADYADAPADPVQQFRKQYRYVLVDEAQDVNPVQHAILNTLCTRDEAGNPKNIFAVGDLKQSIYRFRLAEPELFRHAIDELSADDSPGVCIALRENFRSHSHLIEAINALFERAMVPAVGGITYDQTHRLVAGPQPGQANDNDESPRFEIHLLQRRFDNEPVADPDEDTTNNDLLDLQVIEREAHLIARRIRRLIPDPAAAGTDEPDALAYSNICILLRSAAQSAERVVRVLRENGIPARTDTSAGFFDATEVRDVLALLTLLDNARQDIPLATVMRSPLFGEPFTESQLVSVRLLDRHASFHQIARHADDASGLDPQLREKLTRFFARVSTYRQLARRIPLPDLIWRIYHAHGYLAYVGGLANAAERRANLLHLHQRARQFATFAKQGLHRFLRFIDALRDADRKAAAPPAPQAENAVTVMTVHKAKGLEFPIVFLADAAKKFNDTDAGNYILFHRHRHIAMRAVLPEASIAYPTLDHTHTAETIRLETRAEELRLLYVAATRAKQRFILVASCDPDAFENHRARWQEHVGPLPDLLLRTASNYLDWVLPAVAACPGPDRLFRVTAYTADDIAAWADDQAVPDRRDDPTLKRLADLRPFAPDSREPRASDEQVEACLERLNFIYPAEDMTGLPAVVAAGEVNRRLDYLIEPGESARRIAAPSISSAGDTDARAQGIAVHRFLQHLDFGRPCDADGLRAQLDRLLAAKVLTAEDNALIDLDAVAWFLATELGQRIRSNAANLHREAAFVAAFGPDLLDPPSVKHDPEDRILIRGIIDLLRVGDDEIEIIDYKTDAISPDAVPRRAESYKTQLDIYARAAHEIWKRPVAAKHLVFLTPRVICET